MCEVLCRAHVQQREKYSRGDERRGMCSSGAMDGSNARWWARQHFRIHELLGEPAVPKFCTSHQLLCLYRQRQFAFCTKRSACGTYSQKNPVLRTLSAWFVNMWKMIQKIKHKKHATGSALLHAPLSFSPDRVSRGKNRRIARHSLCTMHGKSDSMPRAAGWGD